MEDPKLNQPATGYVENLGNRILSVDFLRGFIMILLALESVGLYDNLSKIFPQALPQFFLIQFTHHPWHGLHFWDLLQPCFMFIAGVSMAFSLNKQKDLLTYKYKLKKALKRSFWLFFWGVLDYLVRKNGLSFELWDVLTQLSFTTLVTFFLSSFNSKIQIGASIFILASYELLYRGIHIPGFDQPFVDQHNFGNFMDTVLMHKTNAGGWVAINCLSTTAHTLWGLLAGNLLLSQKPIGKKIQILLISSFILLVLGFGLDGLGITPIIKRIATSSFVLASGGFCVLFLTISYWLIDVLHIKRGLVVFNLVGMNSIFLYLFFEIIGDRWFNGYISTISNGVLEWIHLPYSMQIVVTSLVIFGLEWNLCYFLYRKKVFFKV